MMDRALGLDVGSVTVGVALSDPFGWFAQGLETIKIDEERAQYGFERLGELIAEYDVKTLVIGLPKNMNGSLGPRAEASMQYGELAQEQWPELEIVYQDERLSTAEADRLMIEEGNVCRKKRRQVIDQMAASIILQGYLDRISR